MRIGVACAQEGARDILRHNLAEICFAVGDGKEAIRLCRQWLPDVLMLGGGLTGMDGRSVLEWLRGSTLERMPAILALGWHDFESAAQAEIPVSMPQVVSILRQLTDERGEIRSDMRLRPLRADGISRALDVLGVPSRLRGRECLARALDLIVRDMTLTGNLSARLYPAVGRQMGISSSGVERAMRTAVENAWKKPRYEYFGNLIDPVRGAPTVGEFLSRAAEGLRFSQFC